MKEVLFIILLSGCIGGAILSLISLCNILFNKIAELIHNKLYSTTFVMYEPNTVKAYNIQNGNRSTGDCAIRAIAKLFDTSWNHAFDKIAKYAKENGCITSTEWMLLNFFRKHGYSYTKVDDKWYKRSITFGGFAKAHPKGKYAIFSNGHVAAVIDGKLYDCWDSTNSKVVHIMEYVPGKKIKRNTWSELNYTETNNM